MKTYRFKLESVLNFREKMEELLKKEFSAIRGELKKEEERLEAIVDLYKGEIDELLEKGELTAGELGLYRDYMARLKDDIEEGKRVVELFEKKAEGKKEELLEAKKNKKTLDVLKGKGLKRYMEAETRNEQASLDEYNSNNSRKGVFEE
ncbi:MAG: flagellar export protein FliJ [Deltaproteobacteria bacterium]|nr:flagellar export protein FliJ [Deltaproteobacteria bacterium]